MTRRAGLWVAGVVCALAGCGAHGPSSIDAALEAFVPADAVLLAGVRVDRLRGTPVYEKLLGSWLFPGEALAARTGFDPRRDARDLLVASDGRDAIMAARGRFNAGTVPATVPRVAYSGFTIYGDGSAAFAFVNETTAVAGRPEAVRAALDRRAHPAGATALVGRARAIPARFHVWAVVNGAVPSGVRVPNLDRILRSLDEIAFQAEFGAGVHAEARGVCRDEAAARSLGDTLRAMVSLGRLAAPKNDPAAARFYDGIQITQERERLRVTADLPADALYRLLESLGPPRVR